MTQEVIVTGAAGYVGSHVCKVLLAAGFKVSAIDDLSTGKIEFINPEVNFYQGKVQDAQFLSTVFGNIISPETAGVIHCAGLKYAGESVKHPLDYYESNTTAVQILLSTMNLYRIMNLVFSSSSSVYGSTDDHKRVRENNELKPISPYGRSKLFAEQIIHDAIKANSFRAVALRYFNVAGNGVGVGIDTSPFNLFPNLYRAIKEEKEFTIFGSNYETMDGTCIRDYVDVSILAETHVTALIKLIKKENLNYTYNLGSGDGTSVFQIVNEAKSVLNKEIKIKLAPRRDGDPNIILADTKLAEQDLGWKHESDISKMIKSGWDAWETYMSFRL